MKTGIKLARALVHSDMTVSELATAMGKTIDHVYEVLMFIPGTEAYDFDEAVLDPQTITDIVKKSGMIPEFCSRKKETVEEDGDIVKQPPPDPKVLVRRPPVVTIMGHVDHGKTTLLDQLRSSNIVEREFGGITQHIGAFLVSLSSGESICFLDTPGHAAFSAMRGRGAHLTDIIVLVVAADDGVMQQTQEVLQHAQDAAVPIIVAINKIDKDNADVEKTKQMLMQHQVMLEEFGGEVQAVPISALKGIGLTELQEAIVTQAELMQLKGDPKGLVEGRVVEAQIDPKRGRLVTAVVQRGTLKRGDLLVAGTAWAKVRAMFDDSGSLVQAAPPGTPVEILGWKEIPSAGDEFLQVRRESEVKSVLAWRRSQELKKKQDETWTAIEESRKEHDKQHHADLVARREKGIYRKRSVAKVKESQPRPDHPQFSLVLKGDVDGSVEAILDVFDTYHSKKCQLDIIHYGVGNVSESDVEIAATFEGEIFAFNVETPPKVSAIAKQKNVPVRRHNVIYRLFEELVERLNSKLPKIEEEVALGEAKVLQVFQITLPNKKKSSVAGCRCVFGNMSKKLGVKVIRNNDTVYKGFISSMKYFKDEVDSIKKEQECGIAIDDQDFTFEPQDLIVNFEIKEVDQEIDWVHGF
ncbi:translation initiation factor IF-2 [Elysia marginata]|uniref:Translation initiation factor IF-2, mitochondrial n=1 Tax=Elysia marginata TaxID=1093978 RepID=A0AAV4GH17_9GAST|nr:translation initiation factor IF-2 [Elysia marginata]